MEQGRKGEVSSGLVQFKLAQAREAFDQACSLRAADMDTDLVAGSLFYAMYYAVLAMLQTRGIPPATMNVTIGVFDREFVRTGVFDRRLSDALHRAFEFRTSCSCGDRAKVSPGDVEALLPLAGEFIGRAEELVHEDP